MTKEPDCTGCKFTENCASTTCLGFNKRKGVPRGTGQKRYQFKLDQLGPKELILLRMAADSHGDGTLYDHCPYFDHCKPRCFISKAYIKALKRELSKLNVPSRVG